MSMKLEQAVVDAEGYDLIVMGQPEGAGCYCAANSLLSGFLERLTNNYKYIVIDNEAGMEHISRLTTKNIDVLLIVSDTSRRGLLRFAGLLVSTTTEHVDNHVMFLPGQSQGLGSNLTHGIPLHCVTD